MVKVDNLIGSRVLLIIYKINKN
ncbi:uncharacterized protein METZ01_LOCUS458971 [marine metagenome]|uniref:Uncharacterized protein n=1 Tax=marine metagenome TaxID=408172 RepID=A0A383AE74_9ZZZZ